MRANFCTLFDSFYLTRGLAMYRSLERHSSDFHLYIFAFDQPAFDLLKTLKLAHATIISLEQFETPAMLAVKKDRTQAEYCWTSTPSTILHCLEQFKLENCTYLDADLYFYRDPLDVIKSAGGKSVIITPHNYSSQYDQTLISGRYCVQFMYFKNDSDGLSALKWWQAACLDWCYDRVEDGKFGDQKYLDDWQTRFASVHSTTGLGIGLAPWNVQQVELKSTADGLMISERASTETTALYFYHFHGVKFMPNDTVDLGDYEFKGEIIEKLYRPYFKDVMEQYEVVKQLSSEPKLRSEVKSAYNFSYFKRMLSRKLKGIWNVIDR